jgi:hypothetical protein
MAEKTVKFRWSHKSRMAAELVAEDELTDAEIAEKVGIGVRTLYRWKRAPAFVAEVDTLVEDFRRVVTRCAVARLDRRVAALNDLWNGLFEIIEARAADPAMADVPGGTTGLLVRRVKAVGRADDSQRIETYELDHRLLAQIRAVEKQAAQELGQWTERASPEQNVTRQQSDNCDLSVLTDDELETLTRIMAKLNGGALRDRSERFGREVKITPVRPDPAAEGGEWGRLGPARTIEAAGTAEYPPEAGRLWRAATTPGHGHGSGWCD